MPKQIICNTVLIHGLLCLVSGRFGKISLTPTQSEKINKNNKDRLKCTVQKISRAEIKIGCDTLACVILKQNLFLSSSKWFWTCIKSRDSNSFEFYF